MKKVNFAGALVIIVTVLPGCGPHQRTTKVVKPQYHTTYAKNQYRIDIPVGARHIRFLGRKKTKVVHMQ